MRLGAAQNGGVKKPRAGQIADIGSLASEEPPILEALDGPADITVGPHLLPTCGAGLRSPLRYYNDLILSSASVRLSRHAGGGRILGYDEHGLPADGYPHLGHHCCVVDEASAARVAQAVERSRVSAPRQICWKSRSWSKADRARQAAASWTRCSSAPRSRSLRLLRTKRGSYGSRTDALARVGIRPE